MACSSTDFHPPRAECPAPGAQGAGFRAAPGARRLLLGAALVLLASCSSWRQVRSYDSWTLYETADDPLDVAAWEAAFVPAVQAIELLFGPFARPVAVHAWSGAVGVEGRKRTIIVGSEEAGTQDVPGIGPARIQAWHARGRGFGSRSGIYIAEPEVGTAVHELIHAHYAERQVELPLWFEEGVATVIGDGTLWNDRWIVDGLAYWPLRELRESVPSDAELDTLLRVSPGKTSSVAENVLVHFVGWAVVFDLYVETGSLDWRVWHERFDFEQPVADARRRMERTLQASTELQWLERLQDPDPAVRMATARGVWKVRTSKVSELLLDALEDEEHPHLRVAFALNLLAGTSQSRANPRLYRRMRRLITSAFEEVRLPDPRDQAALESVYLAYLGSRDEDVPGSLDVLSRFWSE